MRIVQITGIISLFLILLFTSCVETSTQKKPSDFYDRLEKGDVSSEELDSLMETNGAGSYNMKVPKAYFEITFPVTKTHVKEKINRQLIDDKVIELYDYSANMQNEDDPNLAYQIVYNFVEAKNDHEINQLFDDQRDYLETGLNCSTTVERIVDVNGVPGRELFMIVDDSDKRMSYHMYYANGILYKLAVITSEGKLFNKSSSKFLKSFKILNK